MTELIFKGKEFVYNHHLTVPFRPLVPHPQLSVGDVRFDGNLIVHGDNLHALKALLPMYTGRVDCIYIDPPYNTGNKGWRYNDDVSGPMFAEWLTSNPVTIEDTLRHDKWCTMMYPRLRLLHELLADTGVMFVSIDDTELQHLRLLIDEIFGAENWLGTIVWKNVTDNNPTNVAIEHEYILCIAKDKKRLPSEWKSSVSAIKQTMIQTAADFISKYPDIKARQKAYSQWLSKNKPYIWPFQDYKFIDNLGIFTGSRSVHNPGKDGYHYPVIHPISGRPCKEPLMGYRFPPETMERLLAEERIIFGKDETKIIELKIYVDDFRDKLSSVITLDGRAGANELRALFPETTKVFDNPKPLALIEHLLAFAVGPGGIVLDSFAGSGTTAHAILRLNQQSSGEEARKFILVECEEYAESLTLERVKRAIMSYPRSTSSEPKSGFEHSVTFCTLGDPLDVDKLLTGIDLPSFVTVGALLYHTATNETFDADKSDCAALGEDGYGYLGESRDYHVWLFYRPDLEFLKSRDAALTLSRAQTVSAAKAGKRHLVFAPARFVSQKMLDDAKLSVDFAPLPFSLYRIERS